MINEQISAFLDGEATPEESDNLIAALRRDSDLRSTLSRAHWARHALREARPVALDAGFADRVMAGLDESQEYAPAVVALKPRAKAARASRWQRPAAGLAVAASVVGALVLVSDPFGRTSLEDDFPVTAASQQAPVQTASAGLVQNSPTDTRQVALQGQSRPPDHWSVGDPALEEQLNGYLLEHDGVARGYGLSGATPSLVRVATYGAGQ